MPEPHDPSIPTSMPLSRQNIAIAEVVLFSIIQAVQFPTRYIQEWRYWHHTRRRSIPRVAFYSWWGMTGLLAQLRIAGSALVLSDSNPNKSKMITEFVLQGIGLSPLLFEMSLVLLRSGETGRTGPNHSRYTKLTRLALHFFRFPVFIGIVLIVVGSSINIMACTIAGSAILVLAFAYAACLAGWLVVCYWAVLPKAGRRCVLLVLTAIPFYAVRIVWMLLAEFGPPTFNPLFGDVGVMVGMGLLMEILIIGLLFTARAVAEPFWPTHRPGEPIEPGEPGALGVY